MKMSPSMSLLKLFMEHGRKQKETTTANPEEKWGNLSIESPIGEHFQDILGPHQGYQKTVHPPSPGRMVPKA